MANLTAVLTHLERERSRLAAQLERVNQALVALSVSPSSNLRERTSAAGIARIRAAQKARWAKWRKAHKKR